MSVSVNLLEEIVAMRDIRIAVLPVGNVPDKKFRLYADQLRKCSPIDFADLTYTTPKKNC